MKAPGELDLITEALQSRELSSADSRKAIHLKVEDEVGHVSRNAGGHEEQRVTPS